MKAYTIGNTMRPESMIDPADPAGHDVSQDSFQIYTANSQANSSKALCSASPWLAIVRYPVVLPVPPELKIFADELLHARIAAILACSASQHFSRVLLVLPPSPLQFVRACYEQRGQCQASFCQRSLNLIVIARIGSVKLRKLGKVCCSSKG